MALLRWEWTLANGGGVRATIDTEANAEIVAQGSVTLAKSARGATPSGHVVSVMPERVTGASARPPIEAVVTFEPTTAICILRVDGHEVAPMAWPLRQRRLDPTPERPYGQYALIALFAVTLLGGGLWVRSWLASRAAVAPRTDRRLIDTHRSLNGLFVAHFTPDLEAKLAVLPPGVSGVLLEDKEKTTTIVIAALPIDATTPTDAWGLQQRLLDEAMANVPKGAAKYEETGRLDATCFGEQGATILGRVMVKKTPVGRTWSCAFVHRGAGYLVMYMLAEPAGTADERRVRAIIDATELTHLANLGAPPEPLPGLP